MNRQKIFIVSCLILILTACSPPESLSPITPSLIPTNAPAPTKTFSLKPTAPGPTEIPQTSPAPSPEVIDQRTGMTYHVIQAGETIHHLAGIYHLSDASIIHSNFDSLPNALAPGMTLIIPPVDGFYYIMKDGETLPEVAHRFGVSIISILGWPENGLDQEIETVEPGKIIFIPGGRNPYFDWTTATPPHQTEIPSP